MPSSCGAQFLTAIATAVPGAMRVLMSADPNFRPDLGSLAEARVHSLVSKADLGSLTGSSSRAAARPLRDPDDQ